MSCPFFFFGGLFGEEGGGVGFLITGAISMMAVFCVRSCVMVDLVVSGRVCDSGRGVSFPTLGFGRRAGVGFVVVVRTPPTFVPLLVEVLVGWFRKVTSILA